MYSRTNTKTTKPLLMLAVAVAAVIVMVSSFCIVLASRLMGTECITSQFKEYENKYSHEK